ncbi:MAG: TraB/GumN family protein [Deltaproteobacteria bacterium]|nr:TraB/GumN family protein [Deltaproteobacteria bacterium]
MRVTPGRIAAAIAATLLLAISGCATLLPQRYALEISHALLWRATPPTAASGELVLLGSIHAGSEALELAPSLDAWWRTTHTLAVEVDVAGLSDAETGAAILRRGTLLASTLPEQVSPDTWRALVAFALAHEVDPIAFAHARPWMAAMMVEEITLEDAGMRNEFGVEAALVARARREGRPVESLETLDEQFELFARLPDAVQEQYLVDALSPDAPAAMLNFLALWKRGDAAALDAQIASDTRPEMKPFYDAVFFQRNRRMAERLTEWARDGKPRFVVVGAGHTVGEGSLPALLAEAGWSVERIEGPPPQQPPILAP